LIEPPRSLALLAAGAMLSLACRRDPPRPVARLDASVRLDATPRADAASAAPDAPSPADVTAPADATIGSPIYVMSNGVEMVRPGQPVRLRVYRRGGPDVDVTEQARLRIEAPADGEISAAHVFRARASGRHVVVATVGADEARLILDVSPEVPAGLSMVPSILPGAGLPPVLSLRLHADPQGQVALEVGFVNATLSVSGRRPGRTFPMVVPIVRGTRGAIFDAHRGPAGVEPVEGELVLDRLVGTRLDGHASLRSATRPLRLSFSIFYGDPALTAPLP
jgi:hypothetical protein